MKKYYLVLIVLLSLCFMSCNDDENTRDDSAEKIYLPSKIINRSLNAESPWMATLYFRYDKANRLTYIIQAFGDASPESGDTLSFNYDVQGRMSFVVARGDSTIFNYDGNKVFCSQSYEGDYYRDTLELGTNGELLKLYNLNEVYNYEYDSMGNLIRHTMNQRGEDMKYATTLTYDDKNGLFKHMNTPAWYFIRAQEFPICFVNNTLEEKGWDNSVDIFTCTYNDADYPLEVKVRGKSDFSLTVDYMVVSNRRGSKVD